MKIVFFIFAFLCITVFSYAAEKSLLIEDFEGPIYSGQNGTVDAFSSSNFYVDVSAAKDIKVSGNQALKINYDATSESEGWITVGKGKADFANTYSKNNKWLIDPGKIDWSKYGAISFYIYGSDSGEEIAFDIVDVGNEIWRVEIEDNFNGWRKITFPFSEFYARAHQVESADKNGTLDFPVKYFQFQPRSGQGVLYADCVELIEK